MNNKNNEGFDFINKANQILGNQIDKNMQESILEMSKLQLMAYKSFIELGCSTTEALKLSSSQIEAILRSGKKQE